MEPFKNKFNESIIDFLSKEIKKIYPKFESKKFCKEILKNLHALEMKERVKLISSTLRSYLPQDYIEAVSILIRILHVDDEENYSYSENKQTINGFIVWPLTQFVQDYGIDYFDASMNALYEMTKRFTSEFAIRAFINKYDDRAFEVLEQWKVDPSKHVRRLVSEGTRPFLPWGNKLENVSLTRNLELIASLKDDKDDYVRKSVANHLNDISKIDESLMLDICFEWKKTKNAHVDKIIKHASRSLLKTGNEKALRLNGFVAKPLIEITKFKISKKKIKVGDEINLSFELISKSKKTQSLLIDYIIYYPKKNKKVTSKVFRLKQLEISAEDKIKIEKKISFKDVSIRTLYPGQYFIELKIGSQIFIKDSLQLV